MKKLSARVVLPLLVGSLSQQSPAASPVGNFVLLDGSGRSHELHYHDQRSGVVFMLRRASCPWMESVERELETFKGAADSNLSVFLLADGPPYESVTDIPVLKDEGALVSDMLRLNRAGDTVLVATGTWSVVDRIEPSTGKTKGRQNLRLLYENLVDLLEVRSTKNSLGDEAECASDKPKDHLEPPDYSKDIAPLLMDHCAQCHRPDGVGPWAMTSYTMVLGFSPMIEEVILTRRMPPWHADPEVGDFEDDISLTSEEKKTLISWIRAGSPRGTGPDPLLRVLPATGDWLLGTPDVILEVPSFDVPATGVIEYQYPVVENPLEEDRWVKAVEVKAGDPSVLHHAIVGYSPQSKSHDEWDSILYDNHLMTYIPGHPSLKYPEETGVLFPHDAKIVAQFHYTTNGKRTVDSTQVGLYFHEAQPSYFLRHHAMIDPLLRIPPMEARHKESVYWEISRPIVLYGLFPHAHYRGHSSKLDLVRSDGTRRALLSVPKYDFNWQRYYSFVDPLRLNTGDKLIHSTVYDNSAAKVGNPDPKRTVTWGLQSWDEMLYGAVLFRYIEDDADVYVDTLDFRTSTVMGYMDEDMDGRIETQEMTFNFEVSLGPYFEGVGFDEAVGLSRRQLREILAKVSLRSPL